MQEVFKPHQLYSIHEMENFRLFFTTTSFAALSSAMRSNIIDALKTTKSREWLRLDLATIDFDNILVCKVKYLPSFFDGDVIFEIRIVNLARWVPTTYGRGMDGMAKNIVGCFWCTTKTMNIHNYFGLTFRCSTMCMSCRSIFTKCLHFK